jgi:hypothetical protein
MLSFALGALTVGASHAQTIPLKPPFTEYGAKFTCGELRADADDVAGTYATAINIHNPQATVPVSFIKKVVIANQEGSAAGKIFFRQDELGPDIAERVDCAVIAKLVGAAFVHL